MTKNEIKLQVDDSYRRKIERRINEVQEAKIEQMRSGYGERQAQKVENALEEMDCGDYLAYLVEQDLKKSDRIEE